MSVGPNGLAKTNLNHDAWQVAATYLVTGEDASFKGVKPKRNFDLNNGGWGAWEVVGRYSELNIDDKAFTWGSLDGVGGSTTVLTGVNHYLYADPKVSARAAHTWTAGVNWYLNPEVKFALNYARTSFKGGAGSIGGSTSGQSYNLLNQNTVSDREDESVLLARFQIAY